MIRKLHWIVVALGAFGLAGSFAVVSGQVTPTPIPIVIPTNTLAPTNTPLATDVPPSFTPTDQGPPQLVVPADSGAVNARSEPDTDSFILGQIRAGEQYVVTGSYFNWIQFRYELSPSGVAYVYGELVELIGDTSQIVDLTQQQEAAADESSVNATGTIEALMQTPGYEATLTASVREIEPPSGMSDSESAQESGQGVLPTFTYPPDVMVAAPTTGPPPVATRIARPASNLPGAEGVAPMVPIVIFASLGIIGLLLSTLKR